MSKGKWYNFLATVIAMEDLINSCILYYGWMPALASIVLWGFFSLVETTTIVCTVLIKTLAIWYIAYGVAHIINKHINKGQEYGTLLGIEVDKDWVDYKEYSGVMREVYFYKECERNRSIIGGILKTLTRYRLGKRDIFKFMLDTPHDNIQKYWGDFVESNHTSAIGHISRIFKLSKLEKFKDYSDLESAYLRLCWVVINNVNKCLEEYKPEGKATINKLLETISDSYWEEYMCLRKELESRESGVKERVNVVKGEYDKAVERYNSTKLLLSEPKIKSDFLQYHELFKGYRAYADCKVPLATEETNYKPKHMEE